MLCTSKKKTRLKKAARPVNRFGESIHRTATDSESRNRPPSQLPQRFVSVVARDGGELKFPPGTQHEDEQNAHIHIYAITITPNKPARGQKRRKRGRQKTPEPHVPPLAPEPSARSPPSLPSGSPAPSPPPGHAAGPPPPRPLAPPPPPPPPSAPALPLSSFELRRPPRPPLRLTPLSLARGGLPSRRTPAWLAGTRSCPGLVGASRRETNGRQSLRLGWGR